MKKSVLFFASFIALVFVFGCASMRTIRTEPPGADIYVDGKYAGKSPVSYGFSTGGLRFGYKVRAELDGFYSEEEVIKSHTDIWGSVQWDDPFIRLRKIEK